MNAYEWKKECIFISDVTDNAQQGIVGGDFNDSLECFISYCIMQRNSAEREGFYDSAQYIQHCIDDLEGLAND